MENNTETMLLPISCYIDKIATKSIYHNEIPAEIQDNSEVVCAEIEAGMRVFNNRGYDVIRNSFFVSQTIMVKNWRGDIVEKEELTKFKSLAEYYEFLKGDIYNNAVYYQYEFSKEEISKYQIDTNQAFDRSFIKDTLAVRSKKMDKEEIKEKAKHIKSSEKILNKWKNKFCACTDMHSLMSTANQYNNYYYNACDWEFMLSNFVMSNPERNIPLAVQFLANTQYCINIKYLAMLCIRYRETFRKDDFFDYFDRYNWKRKGEIAAIISAFDSGDFTRHIRKGYSLGYGRFYIKEVVEDPKQTVFYRAVKAEMNTYYETFAEFSQALDYDISDCLLQNAPISENDIIGCKTNGGTLLPSDQKNAEYLLEKRYDVNQDIFIVEEVWRAKKNAFVFKKRTHKFKHFCDYVAFLEGDLSNADLLLCDGLAFLTDFSQINLTGALVVSTIKSRAGLLKDAEIFDLPAADMLETTASTELVSLNNELATHPEWDYSKCINCRKIFYISDLHLTHHIQTPNVKTKEDVVAVINRMVAELISNIYSSDILLIVGDTSYDLMYFKMFVKTLREATDAKIVFVLGNHELWEFEQTQLSDIISTYRNILASEGMYLLQNSILYSIDVNEPLQMISEKELIFEDETTLRARLTRASVIMFGGLAFAGLNMNFNADNAIYKNALTRQVEIEESRKFEALYTKVRDILGDREVIVATHMPLADWSHDVECHGKYVYVSGHTHRNEFFDDGINRIYADNQVGYYRKNTNAKHFYVEGSYDLFADYNDGIYEITRSDYVDFYCGKNARINFNRDFKHLYMLKQNDYYCFIIQRDNGKLAILNGGSIKIIKNDTIESCYENMSNVIAAIKTPLDEISAIQKQISNFVKAIGGNGRIHGAIVDVDFYNHIYVNPNDLKVTGYYAVDMVNKWTYGSVRDLVATQRPDLLPALDKYLTGDPEMSLILAQDTGKPVNVTSYESTDIYRYSNVLKKMQRLHSNILTLWLEEKRGCNRSERQKLLSNNK